MTDTPESDTPRESRAQIFKPAGPGGSYKNAGTGGVNVEKGRLRPIKKKPVSETPSPLPLPPRPNLQDAAPALARTSPEPLPTAPATARATPNPVQTVPASTQTEPTPLKTSPVSSKKSTAKAQSKQAATETMSSMISDMRGLAEKRGGYLTLDDLDNMQGELQDRADQLATTLEKSFETYSNDKKKSEWDKKRNYDFKRLIVKKFAVLFASASKDGAALVSRRMLPGFDMALEMITGPENIERYRDQCKLIIATIKNRHPDDFEGAYVYQSDEAEAIIIDVLVQVAEAFDNFDKRSAWFIDLINAHLSRPDDPLAKDALWEMNTESFKIFLMTILKSLTRELANEERRARLIKRHGAASCNSAIKVIRRLMT